MLSRKIVRVRPAVDAAHVQVAVVCGGGGRSGRGHGAHGVQGPRLEPEAPDGVLVSVAPHALATTEVALLEHVAVVRI